MKELHVTKWGNFCSCEFKHKSTHMLHLCINTETYTNTMSVQETSDWALHSAVGKCMTHTHSPCVDTYSRYRFSALDGQKRSPAHLHTLSYQIFLLYHLLWSTPTISFWLNGTHAFLWRQTQWGGEQVCVFRWRWEAKGSLRAKPPFIIVSSLVLSGQTPKSFEMNHWLL